MTKRNITLTSILLLILAIIIGIILSITKPKALGLGGLGLRTAILTQATYRGGLDVLGRQALAVESQKVNALNRGVLGVDTVELSSASLNVLNG